MSSARYVPETWGLDSEDARSTLAHTGRRRLLVDALRRLRAADGTSHARSLAFMAAVVLVEGLVAAVGLATALGSGAAADAVVRALRDLAPGPAGQVLTQAAQQADRVGSSGRYLALLLGGAGACVTAVIMTGQFERAANRLYGVERDRRTAAKYLRAAVLTVVAGPLVVVAFAITALGGSIAASFPDSPARTAWQVLRWPAGLLLLSLAVVLLLRLSPRRRQPSWSWLSYGAALTVLLSAAASGLLALGFRVSGSFGDTYGPLAGMLALLLWANLSAVAALYGVSICAQLEAVRAGVGDPPTQQSRGGVRWSGDGSVLDLTAGRRGLRAAPQPVSAPVGRPQ